MEPVVEKFLQGIPFAGMGTTLERNGLIGVVREMIKANKYTVDYILNYCESVGYQRKMAEEVFEELTGLSPKLIINNNEYYNAPIYVPACTIAWGMAKSKKDVAFYVVPGSYGYSVMEKNETEAPVEVTQTATIPEAIDELKKVAKNIQTLDKIITSKLLETEDIQSSANDIDQTSKPYFSDPIRELKKNFKDRVIDINAFEREAKKLVAEEKISLDEAENLMNWEQDIINEDESYANDVLQHDEEWNQLQGTETEGDFEDAYHQLFNMLEEMDILSQFAADTGHNEKEAYIELAKDVAKEFNVDYKSLLGEMEMRNPEVVRKIENLTKQRNDEDIKKWIDSSKKVAAEDMTLEDIEEENKTEVEQEMDKINETPINELLEDNTPLDYFEKETQDDKVDTINDVVSKCITEFSDKFKDFNKYDIKMLSYKTKILDPYTPSKDEMIPDNEINADAVLQVILSVNNKADDADIKKLLVVFSITDGKMHWTGTVRDEDDNIVAFTEEGLDSIFQEPEEVTEDII